MSSNITSISESTDPPDSAHYGASDLSVDDLKTSLTEFQASRMWKFRGAASLQLLRNMWELSIPAYENRLRKCATISFLVEHKFSTVELVDRKEKHDDYITPKVSLPNGYAKYVDQLYS